MIIHKYVNINLKYFMAIYHNNVKTVVIASFVCIYLVIRFDIYVSNMFYIILVETNHKMIFIICLNVIVLYHKCVVVSN